MDQYLIGRAFRIFDQVIFRPISRNIRRTIWFQINGVPTHFHREVREYSNVQIVIRLWLSSVMFLHLLRKPREIRFVSAISDLINNKFLGMTFL